MRSLPREVFEHLWLCEHFIGVADDAGPAKITDLIDDFYWAGTAIGEIATVEHEIWRSFAEILQYGLKRGSISVNVRKNRDSHSVPTSYTRA